MTNEERDNIKEGDILLCINSDWHFSKGYKYRVYEDVPVVWCDDVQRHLVNELNLDMFEIIK